MPERISTHCSQFLERCLLLLPLCLCQIRIVQLEGVILGIIDILREIGLEVHVTVLEKIELRDVGIEGPRLPAMDSSLPLGLT